MEVDYRLAFDMAPVGLVLSRNRLKPRLRLIHHLNSL